MGIYLQKLPLENMRSAILTLAVICGMVALCSGKYYCKMYHIVWDEAVNDMCDSWIGVKRYH